MAKKRLQLLLKLTLTAAALFLVFRKIDVSVTWELIKSASWHYLFLATFFFIVSKIFSAYRLNWYFRDLGLEIPKVQNLKLYAIGMFYNLFLPGGIGGDGYKVYLLNKHYRKPVKSLVSAVLLDRINGLVALVFLMFLLGFIIEIYGVAENLIRVIGGIGLILVPVAFYFAQKYLFKPFMGSFSITSFYSLLVQLSQLVCAYFILLSLGIDQQIDAYLFVFLVSSVVAVLPLTIGGVGARELVFILSHQYMRIDENSAVAFSLLFFLITALISLLGVGLVFKPKDSQP